MSELKDKVKKLIDEIERAEKRLNKKKSQLESIKKEMEDIELQAQQFVAYEVGFTKEEIELDEAPKLTLTPTKKDDMYRVQISTKYGDGIILSGDTAQQLAHYLNRR